MIKELGDLEFLKDIPSLVTLSLLGNAVQTRPHYRAYLISKLPNLRVLDFQKVKKQERQEAEELFESPEGVALNESLSRKSNADNTFVPGQDTGPSASSSSSSTAASKLTPEQRAKIRAAIVNAKSDEELSRLEEALQKGKMPKELM
jgi:U2 small nuclear ribonucleoprotein A'